MKHLLILILLLSCQILEPIIFLHVAHTSRGPRKALLTALGRSLPSTRREKKIPEAAERSLCWGRFLAVGITPIFSFLVFMAVKIKLKHLEIDPAPCLLQEVGDAKGALSLVKWMELRNRELES